MPNSHVNLLLIEDNPGDTRLVREMLREGGRSHYFRHAATLAEGLAELERETPDAVLLDLGLPDTQGMKGIEILTGRCPELPVIVLTGLNCSEVGFAAVRAGAQDYLAKEEVTGPALLRAINYAIERQRLKSQLHALTRDLQASENRLRQLIEENSDGILIANLEGIVRFINPAAERLLQRRREEIIGKPFGYPLDAGTTNEIHLLLDNDQERVCELRRVWTEWHGEKVVLASLRDITERQRLERQLRYAKKMESLGNLTRGLAHDFNNILTAIIGYASVLEIKVDGQEPLLGPVRQIIASADRAAGLTRALLSFSRSQPGQMRRLDLLELLTRFLHVLPSLLGGKIRLSQILPAAPLWITGDPAQLEQVLFNLATNARQAMPTGGSLAVTLEHYLLTNDFRQQHGFGKPGQYARIVLQDSGVGMDPEMVQNIFEPFFTTRETGEGSGLGLAISYGIVKQHRGYIICRSAVGAGTSFAVLLPLESPAEG
ncbi:response regulator [Desulfuromonas carbonis]|uniref:hybrid sensor histidine kinase/response regulator n=1 Tax=Desulfuromonas sp. DDH964 TaxID=1823759 RepID=UPI00078BEE85|nr:ATP-binding protein [Desulfuromonas sp. DDH964]AMV73600.1 sensor histidine kinase response regulator, PAS, PAS and PAS domain-containing [Desulfuromonas sp. DDH964]